MNLCFEIDEESEAGRYLLACARIRDISARAIAARIIKAVCEDQLIPAVLDDEASRQRRKGENHFVAPLMQKPHTRA